MTTRVRVKMVQSMRIMEHKGVLLLILCTTTCLINSCQTANILYFLPFGSVSHMNSVLPALEALSLRGHNVTFLSSFRPRSKLQGNVSVLPLTNIEAWMETDFPNILYMRKFNMTSMPYFLTSMPQGHCRALISDPNFIKVATDKTTKYDIVLVDPLLGQCGLALVWLLDSPPLIYYCTTSIYSLTAINLGIPTPLSYVPSLSLFTNDMNFTQRMANLLIHLFFSALYDYYTIPKLENIIREKYPEFPPLTDFEKNLSFVFANSHSASLDLTRPLSPFMAEVGGIHCRPAQPLPKEMEDFVQQAGEDGFFYFSLGTNMKGSSLPQDIIDIFIDVFKRMKQRVVWKFEGELENLPENVRTFKWVPQQDVLGHSKIKAFITQGGQLSLQEAVYHGAPILGLPIFGDQVYNIRNAAKKGMGEELDYDNLSVEIVHEALMKFAQNSSYKENCKYYSALTQDRPMKAIDTIVYWVEYVIRHKGAKHLRFHIDHLNFFQYFLLDVIAVLLLAIGIVAFISFKVVSFIFRFCTGSKKSVMSKRKLQ